MRKRGSGSMLAGNDLPVVMLLGVLGLLGAAAAPAQETPTATGAAPVEDSTIFEEPRYDGEFWYLDPATGQLRALEKATLEKKIDGNVFAKSTASAHVSGRASSFRLPVGAPLVFIVKGIPSTKNPDDAISLRTLAVGKKDRGFTMMTMSSWSGKLENNTGKSLISFTATPYGTSSLKIMPVEPLLPGEYGLRIWGPVDTNPSIFCFGID